MYSDAGKVVGAEFEVAELTALIERALAARAEAQSPSSSMRLVSSSATSKRSATTP